MATGVHHPQSTIEECVMNMHDDLKAALDSLNSVHGLTNTKLDTIATKLDSVIAAIGTTNSTLATISTTLTGIKAKTDGLNYNGLNLRVTGLL